MITSDQHDPVNLLESKYLFTTSPDVAFFMPKI
jgi:hypothetical protein